jgi:type I restriction enzyme S subunit
LPVEDFSSNGELCLNCLCQPRGQAQIKPELFLTITVPLPLIEEQRRILARVEEISAKVDQAQQLQQSAETDLAGLLHSAYRRIAQSAPRRPLREVAPLQRTPATIDPSRNYPQVSVRSFGKGTFHKHGLSGGEITWQKPYLVRAGDILISNIKAWEGAIAVATAEDDGRFGSHRYLTCVPVPNVATAHFVCFHLLTHEGLEEVGKASPGTADRNRTLSAARLQEILVPVPSYDKQVWFDALCNKVASIRQSQIEAQTELDAILPAVLQRTFQPSQ